jgi:hypothetical protein
MKFILKENQINRLEEVRVPTIRKSFGDDVDIVKRLEKIFNINDIIDKSKEFFRKVVTNTKYFKTIVLEPGNKEYEKRMVELVKLKNIFEKSGSCPEILKSIKDEIILLPKKGLRMAVDKTNGYSLLNRLDTHYTAKAFLFAQLILDREIRGSEIGFNEFTNKELRDIVEYYIRDEYVDIISKYLHDLLKEEPGFRHYFFDTIEYSRRTGNEVEQRVLNMLRNKYGENNVIEFSGDFGFVDYFGIDAILMIGQEAHPIQISSKIKSNPKIFKYSSKYCKPMGFYILNNKIINYQPEN